jgi:hypothetical protein
MSNVPAELVDLALNALEDEVGCWRKVPWRPGYIRLMRFPPMSECPIGPAEVPDDEDSVVICHDVPEKIADDMLMRIAMEKVLETVIGAISVGDA